MVRKFITILFVIAAVFLFELSGTVRAEAVPSEIDLPKKSIVVGPYTTGTQDQWDDSDYKFNKALTITKCGDTDRYALQLCDALNSCQGIPLHSEKENSTGECFSLEDIQNYKRAAYKRFMEGRFGPMLSQKEKKEAKKSRSNRDASVKSNKQKKAQTKNIEQRNELEDNILMAFGEALLARNETKDAAMTFDPQYHNLAHPSVVPYVRREELAIKKVRMLLQQYRERYHEEFNVEEKYMDWK